MQGNNAMFFWDKLLSTEISVDLNSLSQPKQKESLLKNQMLTHNFKMLAVW